MYTWVSVWHLFAINLGQRKHVLILKHQCASSKTDML